MSKIYQVSVDEIYLEAFETVSKITGINSYKYTLLFLANLYRFNLIELDLIARKRMKKVALNPQKLGVKIAISMKGDEGGDLSIKQTKKKMEKEFQKKIPLTATVRALMFLALEFLRQKHPSVYAKFISTR